MTQMKKVQNVFSWVLVASEMSHVFCCVLPTIFSLVTLFIGMGLIGAMPFWMESVHDTMHHYEIPMMAMSGFVMLLGWAIHFITKRVDCHDTGCVHGACEPKKKDALLILKIATLLFVVNTVIYFAVHFDHVH